MIEFGLRLREIAHAKARERPLLELRPCEGSRREHLGNVRSAHVLRVALDKHGRDLRGDGATPGRSRVHGGDGPDVHVVPFWYDGDREGRAATERVRRRRGDAGGDRGEHHGGSVSR